MKTWTPGKIAVALFFAVAVGWLLKANLGGKSPDDLLYRPASDPPSGVTYTYHRIDCPLLKKPAVGVTRSSVEEQMKIGVAVLCGKCNP